MATTWLDSYEDHSDYWKSLEMDYPGAYNLLWVLIHAQKDSTLVVKDEFGSLETKLLSKIQLVSSRDYLTGSITIKAKHVKI